MSCTTPVPEPDALPGRPADREDKRSFLQKLAEFIHPGPDSRDELIETLADAEDNQIIGADARVMLERVIRLADMTAGDVMMAAPRMDVLNIDDPVPRLLEQVINTAHSRFPVYQGERGHPVGFAAVCLLSLLALTGEQGAARVVREQAQQGRVRQVEVDDEGTVTDIDTVQDLERAAQLLAARG